MGKLKEIGRGILFESFCVLAISYLCCLLIAAITMFSDVAEYIFYGPPRARYDSINSIIATLFGVSLYVWIFFLGLCCFASLIGGGLKKHWELHGNN